MDEIELLLCKRESMVCYDSSKEIANVFGHSGWRALEESKVAYMAYRTLRALALAEEEDLWNLYGSIISRWPGLGTSTCIEDAFDNERRFVGDYRQQMAGTEEETILTLIRKTLASVELSFIRYEQLESFASTCVSASVDRLDSLAFHHRVDENLNKIFLAPYLPQMENWLLEGLIAKDEGHNPGEDLDVIVLSTANAILHETRHLVGSVLFGEKYATPDLVQGSFAPPLRDQPGTQVLSNTTEKFVGEPGEYFEVSRFGTCAGAYLISSTNVPQYSTVRLRFCGRMGTAATSPLAPLRRLSAHYVKQEVERARAGTFHQSQRFFFLNSTTNVIGTPTTARALEGSAAAPRLPQSQTSIRHCLIVSDQVSDGEPGDDMEKVSCAQTGYRNYSGVLRGSRT